MIPSRAVLGVSTLSLCLLTGSAAPDPSPRIQAAIEAQLKKQEYCRTSIESYLEIRDFPYTLEDIDIHCRVRYDIPSQNP